MTRSLIEIGLTCEFAYRKLSMQIAKGAVMAEVHYMVKHEKEEGRLAVTLPACNHPRAWRYAYESVNEVSCRSCRRYMDRMGIDDLHPDVPRSYPVNENPANVRWHLRRLKAIIGEEALRSLRRSQNTVLHVWKRTIPSNWFVVNLRQPGEGGNLWHSDYSGYRPDLRLFEWLDYNDCRRIFTVASLIPKEGHHELDTYRLKEFLRL